VQALASFVAVSILFDLTVAPTPQKVK